MAVETEFCEEDLRGETCLESNVILSVAPESIIHALLETGVEIFKTLPPLPAAAANVKDFSPLLSSVFVSTIAVVEAFLEFFFRESWL